MILTFWVASPRPMLMTIFSSLGMAMALVRLSSLPSACLISVSYFCLSRAAMIVLRFLHGRRIGFWSRVPMRGVNRCYRILTAGAAKKHKPSIIVLYFFFVGIALPLAFEKRTLVSPSRRDPTRVLLPSASTSMTFEMWMVDSCSAMPPLILRCGLGLTCFL